MDKRLFSVPDLETKGFVSLPYPEDLHAAVENTAESWKAFCSLPENIKKKFPYTNASAGAGYELKTGEGPRSDRKENFDLSLADAKWLEAQAENVQHPVVMAFIRSAISLIVKIKPTIVAFAQECEVAFNLNSFTESVVRSEDRFFVRFIHYFGDRAVGDETATAHTDQSAFTLHLFETDPGLECLSFSGEWLPMPVSTGETVIINAMQMQLVSQGRLKALCHRVSANNKTALQGRYSAVCFVQLRDLAKYNKEKYGRLQEKQPGFNYQISDADFKKFFQSV